ncbi:MAG: hypothetical protein N2C14_32035, partial [Planctomycetales bacterium]
RTRRPEVAKLLASDQEDVPMEKHNPYQPPKASRDGIPPSPSRSGGMIALLCGLFSVVGHGTFCCCGLFGSPFVLLSVPLGVTAILLANHELNAIELGVASPSAKEAAQTGRALGIVGLVISGLMLIAVATMAALSTISQ